MEHEIPPRAQEAMRSVVVVSDMESPRKYCIGFVAVASSQEGTSPSKTLIVAPSSFVKGKRHLTVCFSDGERSPAEMLSTEGAFSLLATDHHRGCLQVSWMDPVTPAATFLLPPANNTSVEFFSSFTMVESTESFFIDDYTVAEDDSKNFFFVSCEYIGLRADGLGSILEGAPVFTMDNTRAETCAMGVVFRDRDPDGLIRMAVTPTLMKRFMAALRCPEQSEQSTEEEVQEDPRENAEEDDPVPRKKKRKSKEKKSEKDDPVPRKKRRKMTENREESASLPVPTKKQRKSREIRRRKGSKSKWRTKQTTDPTECQTEQNSDPPVPRRKRRKMSENREEDDESASLPVPRKEEQKEGKWRRTEQDQRSHRASD